MHWNRVIAALAIGTMALSAACGSVSEPAASPKAGNAELHLSRVKNYDTFPQLQAESSVVAQVTAGAGREEKVNGVTMTVTGVHVDRVLTGTTPATALSVVQFGGRDVASPDSSRLLVASQRYLLFLRPFEATPDTSGDRFTITGDQGAYQLTAGRYTHIGAPGSKLPG